MSDDRATRVVVLGFSREIVARAVLEELKAAIARGDIQVDDWALLDKEPGGKVTITTSRSADPGAVRGAVFGGGAGLVLAVLSGPIGAGAVLGGAAIGAVTAALRDSGFRNDDLEAVARLMADGRSGLLVAVPLAAAEAFEAYLAGNVVFESADRRHQVDITPGHTFSRALEEYRLHEED